MFFGSNVCFSTYVQTMFCELYLQIAIIYIIWYAVFYIIKIEVRVSKKICPI